MDNNGNSRFFSVMVVGDNHKDIIAKYAIGLEVEPYVKYEYLKAEKYLKAAIKSLDTLLSNSDKIGLDKSIVDGLVTRVKNLKKMTPFEYYRELTDGLYYDTNGNALSTENKDGHYNTARIGRNFALPLILHNGEESYSARVRDINWDVMVSDKTIYEAAWELVMEGREPSDDRERQIYESMKNKVTYFSNFKDKEDYVAYSTSYWNYAFVDENGWLDADDISVKNEREWVNNFKSRFIDNLDEDKLVTIYECSIK